MSKGDRWEDHYTRRARDENRRARSVYKLEEIDRRFRLLGPRYRVLDLGAYPGSWSQYSIDRVGPEGDVVGIDLKEPVGFSTSNFRFLPADVMTLDIEALASEIGPRDTVISDLAPSTTGVGITDASRSLELARRAAEIALALLRKRGHFLCKIFEGEDLKSFLNELALHFERTRVIRPSAVRKRSREVYLVGLKRLEGPEK